MKKNIFYIIFAFIISSCASIYFVFEYGKLMKIKHSFKNDGYEYTVQMRVPSNYIKGVIRLGYSKTQAYNYKNRATIYIGENSRATHNYWNIKACYDSVTFHQRFIGIELNRSINEYMGWNTPQPDTIILHGVDSKGNYWFDVRVNYICYGYVDVPQKSKKYFDEAINSFKILNIKKLEDVD